MLLEIIALEFGGFVLRPIFEYECERVSWEESAEAQLHLFMKEYKTKYQAKTTAWYNGYEISA